MSSEPAESVKKTTVALDAIIPWALLILAALAAMGAAKRVTFGDEKILNRVEGTTLLYLGVAGALLLLRQVKTLSFGDYKLEMLEKVQERQAKQQDELEGIAMIIPLLFPDTERRHLLNLAEGKTEGYHGSSALRAELRRLVSIGLVKKLPDRTMGQMADGRKFDLADSVELTDLGRRWVKRIKQIDSAGIED